MFDVSDDIYIVLITVCLQLLSTYVSFRQLSLSGEGGRGQKEGGGNGKLVIVLRTKLGNRKKYLSPFSPNFKATLFNN